MAADGAESAGEGEDADADALPMFPLGTVLFPSMVLPLHVFEHRYRRLVRDCMATTPEMGVVLIARGHEVGGGDVRTDLGTVATLEDVVQSPDGRFGLRCVGTRRIRVRRWLEDAPYPRAVVEDWPDEDDGPTSEARGRAETRLRAVLGLAAEVGLGVTPATVGIAEDDTLASHQMAAMAPVGPHDRQRMLAAPGPVARLSVLLDVLDDAAALLEARVADADGPPDAP